MSPLWSGKNTKQSNNQAKPSPTYNDLFLDSAHNPGIFTNSRNEKSSAKDRFIEESSLLTSRGKVWAGMTVEAALALPLFLFFILSIGSIIEMIRLHGNMQLALWEVGNQAAVYAYAVERGVTPEESVEEQADENHYDENETYNTQREDAWWENLAEAALTSGFLKWLIVDTLGETYLDRSPVISGSDGLILWESDIIKPNGEMELVVTYGVESPARLIGLPYFRMANQYYGHAWTGYQLAEEQNGVAAEVVYIADNAEVYHTYPDCTHLMLTIRLIPEEELESARNLYGGRYSACEKCAEGRNPLMLFIAEEGDRYHYVRECPGLKRTVYTVSENDAAGLPLCSRCDAREE